MKKQLSQKGFSPLSVIILIFILAGAGLVGWRVWETHKDKGVINPRASTSADASKVGTNPTFNPYQGWETYTSTRGKFSLKYPQKWKISGFQDEAPISKDNLNGEETIVRLVYDEDSQNEFGMDINLTAAPPAHYGDPASGEVTKLKNGFSVWVSKQQDPSIAGRIGVCPILQLVTNQSFTANLTNGTRLTVNGSFCWNQKSNPSYTYEQQVNSNSFEQAKEILASITPQ